MKFMLVPCLVSLFFIAVAAFGIEPQTPYLGDTVVTRNVDISSYTTTALITTAEACKAGNFLLVNSGSYDVYLSTAYVVSTSSSDNFILEANGSLALDGKIRQAVYGKTELNTSYTSNVKVILIYED